MVLTAVVMFAAHPIHTENICAAVGRADLICAFFFLCVVNQFLDIIEGTKEFEETLERIE